MYRRNFLFVFIFFFTRNSLLKEFGTTNNKAESLNAKFSLSYNMSHI
jgi:hypothetical protein